MLITYMQILVWSYISPPFQIITYLFIFEYAALSPLLAAKSASPAHVKRAFKALYGKCSIIFIVILYSVHSNLLYIFTQIFYTFKFVYEKCQI